MLIALRPNSAPAMVPSTEMPVCIFGSDACCSCTCLACSARRMRSVSVADLRRELLPQPLLLGVARLAVLQVDAGAERRLGLVGLRARARSPRRRTSTAPAPAAASARTPSARRRSSPPWPPPAAAAERRRTGRRRLEICAASMSASSADAQSTSTAPEPNGTSLHHVARDVDAALRIDEPHGRLGEQHRLVVPASSRPARAGAKNCSTCGGRTGGADRLRIAAGARGDRRARRASAAPAAAASRAAGRAAPAATAAAAFAGGAASAA